MNLGGTFCCLFCCSDGDLFTICLLLLLLLLLPTYCCSDLPHVALPYRTTAHPPTLLLFVVYARFTLPRYPTHADQT